MMNDPRNLITTNRIDVIFKYLYLKYRGLNLFRLANINYDSHINIITNGLYEEPGSHKKNLKDYKTEFDNIFRSISTIGFDKKISQIPLSFINSIKGELYDSESMYTKLLSIIHASHRDL